VTGGHSGKKTQMNNALPLLQALKKDRRIHVLRRTVQGTFALFCIYAGYRFYLFYLWATGRSEIYVPRPPSVEAFLPIGALVNLKQLVLTGRFDTIHPAGLSIFLAALAIALFLRKGFCGWICPIGFISNLAESISRKCRLLLTLPAWLDYPLLLPKYLLLFFFCYVILLKMSLASLDAFNRTTYNLMVDARMLYFFLTPSTLSMGILLFLVAISFFIRNFWCRYLCPYGALLGILAVCSPLQVRREGENCIDCRKCDRICPGGIKISAKKTVLNPECIGCGECVSVCPAKNCLSFSAPGRKRMPLVLLPAGVLTVFFLFYLWAVTTGHWYTEITPEKFRQVYSTVPLAELKHP